MGDRSPSILDSSSVGTNFLDVWPSPPAAPAQSAASAASMTSSPPEFSSKPQTSGAQNAVEIAKQLQQLMRQGSWRAIADQMKDVRKNSVNLLPDESLFYATYHVLALMKLRNYAAAQEELSILGDLNSPLFRFEQHGDLYQGKSGFMVPFGLRWLHAELPHRLGQTSTTIDRLYELLAHCNERVDLLNDLLKPEVNVRSDENSVGVVEPKDGEFNVRSDENSAEVLERGDGEVNLRGDENSVNVVGRPEEALSSLRGESEAEVVGGEAGLGEQGGESNLDEISSPVRGGSEAEVPTLTEEGTPSKLEDVCSNFVSAEAADDHDYGEFVTSAPDSDSGGDIVHATILRRWKRRQEVVLCSVLSHHLEQKDHDICLNWLADLMKKRLHDVVVISKYGYVQLQLGDLYGARRTFATVEAMCERQGKASGSAFSALLARNRGLLYFSLKQYGKAVKEFDAVLEGDPGDVVSANNKALCLMYNRDLVGATHVLETVLQASPVTALNETLVLNLCSMYELASMSSIESKKTLSSWILRIAPDDFDLTCTRL